MKRLCIILTLMSVGVAVVAWSVHWHLKRQLMLAAFIDFETNTSRRLLNDFRDAAPEDQTALARQRLTFLMHYYTYRRPGLTTPALRQMVDDNYEHTTRDIVRLLQKLSPKNLGDEPENWIEYPLGRVTK